MAKRVVNIREENPEEKRLREWFEAQALTSPQTLEEAARLLIGLVTGLLGALFGVLTISAQNLPAYIHLSLVRVCGVAGVILWLAALLAGLVVVLPRQWQSAPGRPDSQSKTFQAILGRKSLWLTVSVVAFGLATLALGIVLVAALLAV